MYPYPVLFGLNLYDISLAVAIITAMLLCDKLMAIKNFSIPLQKLVIVAILFCVLLGFGSAVLFQAFYNYLAKGEFTLSGMTFYGGFIGGAIVFLLVWFIGGKIFLKEENQGEEKRKLPAMFDIAACCMPLAHAIGRIGCFFAGCCHGAETNAWYGVQMHTLEGVKTVVPVQLFEAAFLFLLSAILLWCFIKKPNAFPLMPTYCGCYGIWRFTLEFFRGDYRGNSPIEFLSPSQFIALLLLIFSIAYFTLWLLKRKKLK